MQQQETLAQIEPYKREDGSYDVRRLEQDLGINQDIDHTFAMFFAPETIKDSDPRVALAVEINGRLYDEKKAAEQAATQAALNRALAGTGNATDWRLLEKRGLAVADYDDPESNAPTSYHLRSWRDVDGNEYSDQVDIEENPGRL